MPAPRFWKTGTLHLDPACPPPAINGGYCPSAGGDRQGAIGMTLPADAPALARPTCRLGFPSHCRWRRRAAPPSHPFPRLTLVLFARVVTRGLESVRLVLRWLEMRTQGQPAAAGMQVRTPTSLLFPAITLLIASLRRPTGANSLVLCVPRSPRAFPVPLWHPDSGSSVIYRPSLRRSFM